MWAKKNPSKFWTPGRTLRIAFLNGTEDFKAATISAANNWLPHINLKFDFVEGKEGDIRILSEDGTFSSEIGTDALLSTDEPTMTLWPHSPIHARYFAANVMHEFGHMLGAEHEQTNPTANIPWNTSALYAEHGITEDPEEDNYQARVNARKTAPMVSGSRSPRSKRLFRVRPRVDHALRHPPILDRRRLRGLSQF